MTFAQFIAVHVHHISVVLVNRSREPSWFLHATVAEIHLDGSIVQNAKSLIVTAALNEAEVWGKPFNSRCCLTSHLMGFYV